MSLALGKPKTTVFTVFSTCCKRSLRVGGKAKTLYSTMFLLLWHRKKFNLPRRLHAAKGVDLGGIEWGGEAPPFKGKSTCNTSKLLYLHCSRPNTCYARGNSGSLPLPFEIMQTMFKRCHRGVSSHSEKRRSHGETAMNCLA